MNKPMLEDKDKVAKVYNSKGEVCETFSFRDHGNSYLSAAQNYLMQNYDKLMAEEVEQMDEAHKINDPVEIVKGPGKGTKGYIGEIRHGLYKGAPKTYTVFHGEHGATQVGKEHIRKIKGEVKQMDEAKGEYGPDSSLHGHPLRDIDAHLKDNGYIHSKKSDTTHHYTRKDGRMVVHVDSKTKKVVRAFLEPIKKLKEEVEQMDEVSGPRLGKYIVAAREKEKEEKKKGQEFVQRLKDAGMKGFGAPLYHKGAHFGKASRENMIKLATNKLTNPDFPVSNRVKVPATEEVEHITEMHKLKLHSTKKEKAKGHGTSLYKSPATVKSYDVHRNEPGHSLHGEKVGEIHHVENDDGPSFHGNLYGKNLPDYNAPGKLTAQKFLDHLERTGFAKKASEMKEEVEQMDEDLLNEVGDTPEGKERLKRLIRRSADDAVFSTMQASHAYIDSIKPEKDHERFAKKGKAFDDKSRRHRKTISNALKRLEESEGHSIVKKLKADGKHEEAGKMAFKHGLSRSYGPHFGMRSTKDKDERDFHRGYDIANMESKKKRAGADRAFVAESNSDSAVEGYKNAIIHRLHNMKHPETGENLMFHSLKKHGLDKVKDAVDSSAEFHGEGAEEIGGSDVTAATHTALYHLGEKELVDKLRANARKPLEERSLTPAEEKKKEEIIMAMKEKGEPRYGAATAIAKRVAENKIYTNVIAKLEEGRKPKPPAEGKKPSAAWLRQQEREKTGETETPNFTDQLHKHKDQGELGTGMIKFKDGSSHKVSHEQREKALRFMRSLVGPGKNPDVRDKKIAEMGKSHAHFLHHIGEKPMDSEKLHPMSAQKK